LSPNDENRNQGDKAHDVNTKERLVVYCGYSHTQDQSTQETPDRVTDCVLPELSYLLLATFVTFLSSVTFFRILSSSKRVLLSLGIQFLYTIKIFKKNGCHIHDVHDQSRAAKNSRSLRASSRVPSHLMHTTRAGS